MSDVENSKTSRNGLIALLVIVVLLAIWGLAIATWGYGAIILTALALTLLSLVSLVLVTRG